VIENKLTDELAAIAFMQNPIAMLILDEKATILNINCSFEQLTGYNEIDCLGKSISLFDCDKNKSSLYELFFGKMTYLENENNFEIYIRSKNKKDLLVRKRLKAFIYEDKKYIVCTLENIMEEKKVLEHYQHMAMHDPLTGLANRVLLEDRFDMAEHRATRHQQKMALLLCDINGFKTYNDRFGHDFGDEVLRRVAKRLESLLRRNDIVCRYGGDEFVLILEDIAYSDTIAQIVIAIKAAFPITVMQGSEACEITMSIGTACYPADGRTFHQLIRVADKNMYEEKNRYYNQD
jgi:diguanylate cyclase (GGDEF)-like protein/PAS domain S-box-containing protein